MLHLNVAPQIVLRSPTGPAVRHLLLQVPPGHGGAALHALSTLSPSFGPHLRPDGMCSVGITFAGLVALGLPLGYQRIFMRQARAFYQGAPRRAERLGDGSANAPSHWQSAFRLDRAHVLVSWHGTAAWAEAELARLERSWPGGPTPGQEFAGQRLGAPPGEVGEWVHFGYREHLTEVVIDPAPPTVPDPRRHHPGELLLGFVNDAGYNAFALPQAPEKVRQFFQGGSFGVFRPMQQDVADFEQWVSQACTQLGHTLPGATPAYVKAKLCGRWPNGQVLAPGELEPPAVQRFVLAEALAADPHGQGCPFGAHVRRMRERDDSPVPLPPRPLQRRSLPYGPASWHAAPDDHPQPQGLLGHFFCASIEAQFEHLLGQWAHQPPLGADLADTASDPLTGLQAPADATLLLPRAAEAPPRLTGLRTWTTTQGTAYLWHPDLCGWKALLRQDYVPVEDDSPW